MDNQTKKLNELCNEVKKKIEYLRENEDLSCNMFLCFSQFDNEKKIRVDEALLIDNEENFINIIASLRKKQLMLIFEMLKSHNKFTKKKVLNYIETIDNIVLDNMEDDFKFK